MRTSSSSSAKQTKTEGESCVYVDLIVAQYDTGQESFCAYGQDRSLLHAAVSSGKEDIVRHLLSKGASLNISDDEVVLQLAPKSALKQCRQQKHRVRTLKCGSLLYRQTFT